MTTRINAKQLAQMYAISYTVFHEYLRPHRAELLRLARTRVNKHGRVIKAQDYNCLQLQYIIDIVMGDYPEGYRFNGTTLVKEADKQ